MKLLLNAIFFSAILNLGFSSSLVEKLTNDVGLVTNLIQRMRKSSDSSPEIWSNLMTTSGIKTLDNFAHSLNNDEKRIRRQAVKPSKALQRAKQLYDLYQWSKKLDIDDRYKPFRKLGQKWTEKLAPRNQDGALSRSPGDTQPEGETSSLYGASPFL
ncbi:hypothetical protein HDE_04522 [Halotydeus destructor]|nr:hypothetical protein HDE_04522 [Halotydeus destructor]